MTEYVVCCAAGTMAQSVAAMQNSCYACVAKVATWCEQVKATSSTIHCPYGEWAALFFLFHYGMAGGCIMFWGCPSVPSFHRCICSWVSITKLVNTIFWKQMNHFLCRLAQMIHGWRAWNDQLWVKVTRRWNRLKKFLLARCLKDCPTYFDETRHWEADITVTSLCVARGHMKPKIDLETWWRHCWPHWVINNT